MINPSVYKSMPFDAQKDLAPITNVLRVPLVLAVHPSMPAKNLKELLAWIDANKAQGAVRVGRQRHAAAHDGRALQDRRQALKDSRTCRTRARRRRSPTRSAATCRSSSTAPSRSCRTSRRGKLMPDRGHERQALAAAARRADLRRGGPEGRRVVRVVRLLRARQERRRTSIAKLNAEALKVDEGRPSSRRCCKDTGSEYVGDTPENFAKFIAGRSGQVGQGREGQRRRDDSPLGPEPEEQGRQRRRSGRHHPRRRHRRVLGLRRHRHARGADRRAGAALPRDRRRRAT